MPITQLLGRAFHYTTYTVEPPITHKWAGLVWAELRKNRRATLSRSRLGRGVYVRCWLLAGTATRIVTVVA